MSQITDSGSPDGSQLERSLLMQISNELVRLFKEHYGRGPTRARAHWAAPDVLVVVLEETLTPAERMLVNMGEEARLRDSRMFFQYARERATCEPVERLTGRRVRSYVTGIDTAVDGFCVETFVLYPRGSDGERSPEGRRT